jgi:hypothetical protein
MTNYWMLEVRESANNKRAVIAKQPILNSGPHDWLSGMPLNIELNSPLEYTLSSKGDVTDFFPPAIPLMSVRMLTALIEVGVTNIEFYPAILLNSFGHLVQEEFCAVNILGSIKCADLDASECEYDDIDDPIAVDFDALVIDEARAEGHLFFRLYESVNAIVVHDSVKKALEPLNLRGIVFVKPENWVG